MEWCWQRGWSLARPPEQRVTAMVWRLPSSEGMGLVWTLKPAQRGQASRTPGPRGLEGKDPAVLGSAASPPLGGRQQHGQ